MLIVVLKINVLLKLINKQNILNTNKKYDLTFFFLYVVKYDLDILEMLFLFSVL